MEHWFSKKMDGRENTKEKSNKTMSFITPIIKFETHNFIYNYCNYYHMYITAYNYKTYNLLT